MRLAAGIAQRTGEIHLVSVLPSRECLYTDCSTKREATQSERDKNVVWDQNILGM